MEKIEKITQQVLNEIDRQLKIDRITKDVMTVLNDLVENEEKWITIKPHGEESEDYRRLKLQDGETPKEAIERIYKKENKKELSEDNKKEIEKLKHKIDLVGKNTVLGKKYQAKIEELQGRNKLEVKEEKTTKKKQILFAEFQEASNKEKEAKNRYFELVEKANQAEKNNKKYQELDKKYKDLQNELMRTKYYDNREKWNELVSEKNKVGDEKYAIAKEIRENLGVYKAQNEWSDKSNKASEVKKASFDNATNQIKDKIKELSKRNDKVIKNIENSINLKEYNDLKDKLQIAEADEKTKFKKIDDTPFMSEERNEARKIWRSAMDEKIAINKKIKEYQEKFVEIVNKELQIKNGIKDFNFSASPVQKDNSERLKRALNGVIPENVYSNKEMNIKTHSGRAYQSGSTINVNKNEKIGTLIHEMLHNVEEDNPTMLLNSLAFANYRTQGEKQISLKKLTGNSGYKASEICKKDNFFEPYCGKFYTLAGGKNQQYVDSTASEIMSMGVQELFTNPLEFAKKDREYFDFVIANLRGEI